MGQLSLRERLQPALFDRLIDNERLLTCYEFAFQHDELRRLGISERELVGILTAQGLRVADPDSLAAGASHAGGAADIAGAAGGGPHVSGSTGGSGMGGGGDASGGLNTFRLRLFAAGGLVSVSHLKSLVLKPPGNPKGVALQSFATITARNVVNSTAESGELKSVSMRRLRDYVCRDLAALLNCANLDAVADLNNHQLVQSSVLNFGMPSLAGRAARSADPQEIATAIELAIRRFEPRLSELRVTPEMGEEGNETHVLTFRIEAQLWGQVTPQQLVLRTSVEVDSGRVSLADSGVS